MLETSSSINWLLIGTTFFEQCLVANSQTPGCPSFPFVFPNALQLQIQ